MMASACSPLLLCSRRREASDLIPLLTAGVHVGLIEAAAAVDFDVVDIPADVVLHVPLRHLTLRDLVVCAQLAQVKGGSIIWGGIQGQVLRGQSQPRPMGSMAKRPEAQVKFPTAVYSLRTPYPNHAHDQPCKCPLRPLPAE